MTVRHPLHRLRFLGALAALDELFFCLASPRTGNAFVIILGCILLSLTIYTAALLVARVLERRGLVTTRTAHRLALLLASFVVFLILLQSIGQLSARDVLAAIPLALVLYLYITYTSDRSDHASR